MIMLTTMMMLTMMMTTTRHNTHTITQNDTTHIQTLRYAAQYHSHARGVHTMHEWKEVRWWWSRLHLVRTHCPAHRERDWIVSEEDRVWWSNCQHLRRPTEVLQPRGSNLRKWACACVRKYTYYKIHGHTFLWWCSCEQINFIKN